MEIDWFGQSCFRLREGNVTIVTDPADYGEVAAQIQSSGATTLALFFVPLFYVLISQMSEKFFPPKAPASEPPAPPSAADRAIADPTSRRRRRLSDPGRAVVAELSNLAHAVPLRLRRDRRVHARRRLVSRRVPGPRLLLQ